jgi:two-component system response regulator HydG
VRELRNVIERLALLSERDSIDVSILESIAGAAASTESRAEIEKLALALLALPEKLGSKIDLIERVILHHAVEVCAGNKSAAARLVGVDRKAFERRLERLSEPSPTNPDPDPGPGREDA